MKSGKRGLTCFAHIAICDVPRTGWNKVMVEVGRFVEELKAAGIGLFADVLVRFPCGCHSADKRVCANDCINELYQKGLPL